MTPTEKKLLFSNPLFKNVGNETIENNSEFLRIALFRKGEAILGKNSFERCLVFVLKGKVSVYKISAQGKRTCVNCLSEGDIFGMATLFYETDYPSEIVAESSCKVIVFQKKAVENFLVSSQDFAREYIVLLSQKIHFLNDRLGTFTENEVSEKLLSYLKTLSGGKKEFVLNISVSRLAENLNVGRASVYRAFESLAERKILEKTDKTIVFKDPVGFLN